MTTIAPIAHMKSAFSEKFGIPRQSNLVNGLKSAIVFTEEFRNPDALRGLEAFSRLWLIWGFSEARQNAWSPTVRPPRLGGNRRLGVFATRSPFRPNGLGLSCVKLDHIEQHPSLGPVVHVLGGDLMDGTPIYDLKPYLPYTDAHPEASGGFADAPPKPVLTVQIPPALRLLLSEEIAVTLEEVLALDPRPPYQQDPQRIYGLAFHGHDIQFTVSGQVLHVINITPT